MWPCSATSVLVVQNYNNVNIKKASKAYYGVFEQASLKTNTLWY